MNDYFAWNKQLEELVNEDHCRKFASKKTIQQIEDHDATKQAMQQKVIQINTILADSKEFG